MKPWSDSVSAASDEAELPMVPPYPGHAELYPRLGPRQWHRQFGWDRRGAAAWAAVRIPTRWRKEGRF